MQRQLPIGQVENGLEVFSRERPIEFGIRTTSGPTAFLYRYRFASDGADTVVRLDASVELAGATTHADARRRLQADYLHCHWVPRRSHQLT
jgi:hypothetical protein